MADIGTEPDFLREIDARMYVAEILGSPNERRALRQRLGLSIRDVAAMTGLSPYSVWRRESEDWKLGHGSLESPGGIAYIRLIERARGQKTARSPRRRNGRASPVHAR
jgi:hypothetical protein